MAEIDELEKARTRAEEKYKSMKASLQQASEDPVLFQTMAQASNDAYLEFKRIDEECRNHLFMKKLGDLYGI